MSRPKLEKTKKKEAEKPKQPIVLPPVVDRLLDIVAQVLRRRQQKKVDLWTSPNSEAGSLLSCSEEQRANCSISLSGDTCSNDPRAIASKLVSVAFGVR